VYDAAQERLRNSREACFVTNAVKQFKYEPRGKRRLHKRPNTQEIEHCRFWLDQERRLVDPKLVVAMGATATRAILGKTVTISQLRGQVHRLDGKAHCLVTVHPSYLLRITEETRKRSEWKAFLGDLAKARDWLVNH
jgi:DNA polymerase